MSDYNLQIPWSGKDALQDSDPDKVVSGGDFNTEFLAVKTAVNSKANLGGSSSQAFASTTATAGNNTTQVATTAFVDASFAKKASPPLTGTPTAPTASVNTNTTQIATTAFVQAAKPVAATSSVLGLVKVSLSGTTLTISTS
jgi:hypothetical protein